jgi:cytoskeletal protein CcmA (bactofilin family)
MALFPSKATRRLEPLEAPEHDLVGHLEAPVEVEGRMKVSSGLIRLDGHFKGEIVSEGFIEVNEPGEIEGEIHTKWISINGKVKGTVHASEVLAIRQHGVVLGDIYTPKLIIEPGGYFDGQCHMPTPEPEKQPTLEPGT